jgi:hypothetical protein
MTSVFILDDNIKKAITSLVATAKRSVVKLETIHAVMDTKAVNRTKREYMRQMRRQTLYIMSYAFTYSLEYQPGGLHRHLSASVDRAGRVPLPEVLNMVLPLFEFRGSFETTQHWLEDLGNDRVAINLIESVVASPTHLT